MSGPLSQWPGFGPGGPNRFIPTPLGDRIVPNAQGQPAHMHQVWPGPGPNQFGRSPASPFGDAFGRSQPSPRGERIVPSDLGKQTFYIFPGSGPRRPFMFQPRSLSVAQFVLSGVTRDQAGVRLPNCVVELFRTDDNLLLGKANSDAAGNYSFSPVGAGPFFVVAYESGSPDVAGTTVNTLRGA